MGEQDVFPEEFALFLCQDPKIRGYLQKRHANLFTAEYWQGLQNRIRSGYIEDVYAYREDLRFSLRFGQEPMQRLSG